MTKRLGVTAVSLLLLLAAGAVAVWFVTAPGGTAPEPRPQEAVPQPRVETPPSVASPEPEPRDEPVAVGSRRSPVSAPREEGNLKDTIQRFAGQVQYCYEQQLKANPSLEGRVVVGWTVSDGAVTGTPSIVENTSGDAALADCVAGKIRRWRFPAGVEGEVSWPFVFQSKR